MVPTAALEATRAEEMFVIGTTWPTKSKVGATATKPTKGLLLFVYKAAMAWDEAHVAALSAAGRRAEAASGSPDCCCKTFRGASDAPRTGDTDSRRHRPQRRPWWAAASIGARLRLRRRT